MIDIRTTGRGAALVLLALLGAACAGLDGTVSGTVEPPAPDVPSVPPTVRVAAIQAPSTFGAPEWNRDRFEELTRTAAAGGARIVVLPECALTGYLSQDLRQNWHVAGRRLAAAFEGHDPARHAETVPGPSTERFARLADELDVYLTIPFLEVEQRPDGPVYFNTVCLAAPDGRIVAHYRKLTPWPYPEDAWATPGDRGVQTFDTEYGRVGLAICFDIHTILERYREHELWALLYLIAWVSRDHPVAWFRELLPARIADAGHHLIGANWSVERPVPWFGYGYSTIVAADGAVVAQAATRMDAEIVYADLPTRSTTGTPETNTTSEPAALPTE